MENIASGSYSPRFSGSYSLKDFRELLPERFQGATPWNFQGPTTWTWKILLQGATPPDFQGATPPDFQGATPWNDSLGGYFFHYYNLTYSNCLCKLFEIKVSIRTLSCRNCLSIQDDVMMSMMSVYYLQKSGDGYRDHHRLVRSVLPYYCG